MALRFDASGRVFIDCNHDGCDRQLNILNCHLTSGAFINGVGWDVSNPQETYCPDHKE